MKFLLDTNICIYVIRNNVSSVVDKFSNMNPTDLAVSSISVAELYYGIQKSSKPAHNAEILSIFLKPITVLSFDETDSRQLGIIRNQLEQSGTPIGAYDMLIAAHAKSKNLILVTNNTREFSRVKNLKIENWIN